MDESTGGVGLADLLRALLSSVAERGRFGENPRGFLGDRGLGELTRDDVREAVTMSAEDLAPAAGVTVDALTAPAPAGAGAADPLDGAIAEISRVMGFVDPDFAVVEDTTLAAVAPDDPPPDEEPAEPEEVGMLEDLGNQFEDIGEGVAAGAEGFYEGSGADDLVDGVVEAFKDIGQGGIDTLDRVDEELDEASADFDEGDIAAGALGSIGGALLSPVAAAAETAGDVAGDLVGGGIEAAGDILGAATHFGASVVGIDPDNAEAASEAVQDAADYVAGAVDAGLGYVGEGAGYVVEGVGEVVEGVGEVIDEGIEAVGDAAEEVGDWLGL